LSAQRSLQLILQDARSLQERLRSQDTANPTSFSDEVTLLLLEIDALNRGTIPLQFQVSSQPSWSDKTVGDQIAFIDSLIRVLENKQVTLEQEASALEPDILTLQEKLQRIETEQERLQRSKDMTGENLDSLTRKVTETQLSSENTVGSVRLASAAYVRDRPVSPRKLSNTAIAGAAGCLAAVLCVLALAYWRQSQPQANTK
jgi:chromosome segregation ATPase